MVIKNEMNTGHKISITYSAITIGLVLLAGLIFYIIFSKYTENLYFEYLQEKAHVVATERFEKDELSPEKYKQVVQLRKRAIPTSQQYFINLSDHVKAKGMISKYLSDTQLSDLFKGKDINFKYGDEVGCAFTYDDNEGMFAVIVMSRNPYGEAINQYIGIAIMAIIFVSAIILYLISRLYAIKVVNRIDKNYQTEKMFVNNASHEINNPLTAIQGECEITLMRERTPQEYINTLQRINEETDRIINIMSQLLQFSHTRMEKINETEIENVNMADFMQTFTNEHTLLTIENNFSVAIKENLLHIAIRNLVNNAHKYSGEKPISLTLGHHQLIIQDYGIGIPEDEIQHIFEPFYRASNTTSIKGHGIGLALAHEILEKYGCKLTVSSKKNNGTKICITFKKTYY